MAAHPIGGTALAALTLVEGQAPTLSDEGERALTAELAKLKASLDLKEAVAELLYVAAFLELHQGAPVAAEAMLAVARASIPWLKAQGIGLDDVLTGSDAEKRMDALTGRAESKVPVGQRGAAPTGASKWWQLRSEMITTSG